MRKTKIVCTLGPSTDREEVLRGMILAGMNVARFNFSHGTHPEHLARLEKLKAASANVNTFVEKAKQYTAIDELTPELLRLFIQRIEVGERTEKYSRSSHQSIRIVYRDIGTVDSAMEQGEAQPRIAPPLSEVFELPA